MREGVRLAIDLGEKRIGVARCDAEATMALPVETVYRCGGQEIYDIVDIVDEYQVMEIIIGLPRLLSGAEGKNSADVRQWAKNLSDIIPEITIRLVDERLTSVSAHRSLSAAGVQGRKQRFVVDQQAAVCILNQALEIERKTGSAPGEKVQ